MQFRIITTSVGPGVLPYNAPLIAGIKACVRADSSAPNVIACQNRSGASTRLKNMVKKVSKVDLVDLDYLNQYIDFANAPYKSETILDLAGEYC
jgi:mannitol-1-phosphate/altronate dehydrogenase